MCETMEKKINKNKKNKFVTIFFVFAFNCMVDDFVSFIQCSWIFCCCCCCCIEMADPLKWNEKCENYDRIHWSGYVCGEHVLFRFVLENWNQTCIIHITDWTIFDVMKNETEYKQKDRHRGDAWNVQNKYYGK